MNTFQSYCTFKLSFLKSCPFKENPPVIAIVRHKFADIPHLENKTPFKIHETRKMSIGGVFMFYSNLNNLCNFLICSDTFDGFWQKLERS